MISPVHYGTVKGMLPQVEERMKENFLLFILQNGERIASTTHSSMHAK
jgi:hypothetical protein